MNPSLLVYCYPTYGNDLHLDSKNASVVLAPDEVPAIFLQRSHHVEVVNFCPHPTDKPLMRSKLVMKRFEEVDHSQFDLCWHMFRDPIQPEVWDLAPSLGMHFPLNRTINHVSHLRNHFKHIYLPILAKHGVGATVRPDIDRKTIEWGPEDWSTSVSLCGKYIRVYDYNNNRGNYPERERRSHIVVDYLDGVIGNRRYFFRVGYAAGKLLPGWIYSSLSAKLVQKSGTCDQKTPHTIPTQFHPQLVAAFQEMGVDAAHIEGTYVDGQVKIFDVNPYPTSYGATLHDISVATVDAITEKWLESGTI
jgi:hypothetical protein